MLLVFGVLFVASSSREVTYYVVTSKSPNSSCPGQPCQSLLSYINNAEMFFNREENITMKFSKGVHYAYCFESDMITIHTPYLALVGEGSQTTQVYCMNVHFNNTTKLHISQLKMSVWNLTVTPAGWKLQAEELQQLQVEQTELRMLSVRMEKGLSSVNVRDLAYVYIHNTTGAQNALIVRGPSTKMVELSMCTFRDSTRTTFASMKEANVTMRDCTFRNSPVLVYDTKIVLAGTSLLMGSQKSPALLLISGTVVLSGSISFTDNFAFRGAAMALFSSLILISPGADVVFANNSVYGEGGAVFIDLGLTKNVLLQKASIKAVCFYQLLDCHENSTYSFHFANNSAERGGNDIYGASLRSGCESTGNKNCRLRVTALQGVPSVSSNPTRVCVCDNSSQPHCTNKSYILLNRRVRPGEVFTLPVVVVGGDLGPTVGVVYAILSSSSIRLTGPSQHSQLLTTNKQCTLLNYSVYDNSTTNNQKSATTCMYLKTYTSSELGNDVCDIRKESDDSILTTPIKVQIDLSPCPQGFTLLGEPPICDCYPELSATDGVQCKIINGKEIFSWQGGTWIASEREGVVYSRKCPSNYCRIGHKEINIRSESDVQCAFNRAGRLCGGCKDNFSLAIGSSHCVPCPSNNHHTALVAFFAAAGVLLVCFINALNLTVTEGMINGIIFYANIVWRYQAIFFAKNEAENTVIAFLKTFIAWVNLDFGIETCFVNGLTAFWKTWLQFFFPFYIWAIAGLIIVGTRYSSRLTRIFGSRAVPVLNTLILLSYMKLLNTAVSALEFSFLTYSKYPTKSSKSVVWSVDGNLAYLGIPHVFLFLAAVATLLFLWLPYTLFLLLAQWLRKLPESRFTKRITQLHPVYDAYLAPLKHTHQYWFGILLLVRGALLVTFASTLGISAHVNLFILLILSIILLLCIAIVKPYKSVVVCFFQMSSIANLTALSGFFFFSYTQPNGADLRVIGVGLSVSLVFLKFCGIVLHAVILKYGSKKCCYPPPCKRKVTSLGAELKDDGGIDYVRILNSYL